MKWKQSILSLLVLVIFIVSSAYYQTSDGSKEEAVKMSAVEQILDRAHFQPVDMDEDFAQQFFDLYLKRLDVGKKFITQGQIDALSNHKVNLHTQLQEKTTEFFDESLQYLEEGIARGETYVDEIMDEPMDFTIAEKIEMDYEEMTYAKDEKELRELWRKTLKYETLAKYREKLKAQEENGIEDEAKSHEELEEESREEVKELYEDWFERLAKLRRADRFGDYLNTMTNLYDPHSDYYSPKEKEDFDINMGRSLEGIGARLRADGDYVKVASIVPGGPAYKQKGLDVDDAIIQVAQAGEEPVHAVGMRIDDVVGMIRGDKGTDVILTVRKVDGQEEDIRITRDKVILDEGKARSVVLDHAGAVSDIGYISLPRFYADFDDPNGNSCADDIKAEIEKLKEQNVRGIILDLRNNGGGSLRDVVEMTGFFIEEGPIVQVKGRDKKPTVYRDTDAAVQYDGPLIVMVNQNSASASEIIAAALQDYQRAVIVGSPSTFGKGTVQRFIDLDRYVMGQEEYKPLGEVKVTMQKFYRVNGGSTQLKGVEPDIVLPNSYHFLESGEKEMDRPLPWTEIEPVNISTELDQLSGSEIKRLKKLSEARVAESEEFAKILRNAERLKRIQDDKEYPLSYDAYDKVVDQREQEAKEFKDIFEPIEDMEYENLPIDLEFIQADSSRIARNDSWLKRVKKDHYLQECLYIMRDMIGEEEAPK